MKKKAIETPLHRLMRVIIEQKLWGIVLILLSYGLLYPLLFSLFSKSSINFYLLPAVIIAYFYGPWWGAAGGLLFWPVHILLFKVLQVPLLTNKHESFPPFLNFWTTYFITIIIAFLVGHIQNIRKQYKEEIASRQRVSNALRQSEKRYRELLNHSSNIIVLFEQNGIIEYISPSSERLTQFPTREIIGQHFAQVIHPDWRIPVCLFYARQVKRKKKKTYHEFPIRTKSGKTIWVAHVLELLFDEGEVTGGQSILLDITSRHEAQQALVESEKRFRALTEHGSDITIIVDKDKFVQYISPSIFHITGFTPNDIEKQDIRQFFHPDDQTAFIQLFQQTAESEPGTIIKTGALKWLHSDGRWLYFDGVFTNMLNIEFVNGIVCNIREITNRVEMEQALWESEYNFRTLFNQANDAVVILSLTGQIKEFNQRFAALLGITTEKLEGKAIAEYIAEEEIPSFTQKIHLLTNGNQMPVSELNLINKKNKQIPTEVNMGLVKNSQGEPQKVLAIFRDISERKQTEQKLRFLATHDPLTEIPNRNLFYTRLIEACRKALESDYEIAVVFIDLNKFKNVNDQYGHHAGDQVLHKTAERIKKCVRKTDTVARISGDEFTILLEGIESPENVVPILKKIAAAIETPMELSNYQITISGSMGVSIFPADDINPDIILQNADKAMYAAKNNPDFGYCFYSQIEEHTPSS